MPALAIFGMICFGLLRWRLYEIEKTCDEILRLLRERKEGEK